MKKLLFILLLLPLIGLSQTDVLELKKNGKNIRTYSPGMYLVMETVYDQWLEGYITAIRHDSVFLNNFPFHYKEIKTIRYERTKFPYKANGILLMIAGGGVLLIGTVNGLYRGDPANQWFTPVGYITAGAMLLGGYFLMKAQYRKYRLGKKYTLDYLNVNINRNEQRPF
ncbi:MAG: hypothetical protein ACHQET_10625 [Chitinophagales bacterium]